MLSSLLAAGLLFVPLVQCSAGKEVPDPVKIGGHACTVFNNHGNASVVVIFHGKQYDASDYYSFGKRIAKMGYTVVIPVDFHTADGTDSPMKAPEWGESVAAAVQAWAGAPARRVAYIGHSMGGGAAMAVAKTTPGIAAIIALHPAPMMSGDPGMPSGPILFTTGSTDTMVPAGVVKKAYWGAAEPKAVVNVKGDEHPSAIDPKGMQWAAVSAWLQCFVKASAKDCAWLLDTMCKDQRLESCSHKGLVLANQVAGNVVNAGKVVNAVAVPAPTLAPLPVVAAAVVGAAVLTAVVAKAVGTKMRSVETEGEDDQVYVTM